MTIKLERYIKCSETSHKIKADYNIEISPIVEMAAQLVLKFVNVMSNALRHLSN